MKNEPNLHQSEAIYKETSPKGDSKSVSLGLCPVSEVSTKPDVVGKITKKIQKKTKKPKKTPRVNFRP